MPVVYAEIKGKRLKGSIREGDIIKIKEKYKQGKIFTPKRVLNLTIGIEVGQR
jgi:hypothetical protein